MPEAKLEGYRLTALAEISKISYYYLCGYQWPVLYRSITKKEKIQREQSEEKRGTRKCNGPCAQGDKV